MRQSSQHMPGLSQQFIESAQFYDYRRASNPLRDGGVHPIPGARFAAQLHEQGPTQILPLDTSSALGSEGTATTPGLCANFIHVQPDDSICTNVNATSQLFFVMRGQGTSCFPSDGGTDRSPLQEITWKTGDLFTLPAQSRAEHFVNEDTAIYWVHDAPLLQYLGATATTPRFQPTLYPHQNIQEALDAVIDSPESAEANRLSVLLGNKQFSESMTITHVLWAMFGILPVDTIQSPHRHQSVAVDLVVDAKPGCYTMVGKQLAADGSIEDGERFDWQRHSVFVTPPGLWHSHHNESGQPAYILPIQDAGLHTYLRTLNILFSRHTPEGHDIIEDAG